MLLTELGKEEQQNNAKTQVIIAALNEEEGIGLTITEIMDVLESPLVPAGLTVKV